MADLVRNAVIQEMDTNDLFEKFTIDEIREIEKKTRADIERKKEDLRQMVGERYRDLIEAADTITEMKQSSENVMGSIKRMQELCQNLKNISTSPIRTRRISTRQSPLKMEDSQFYGIATQIKVLHDMPEKIWSALDRQNVLQAAQLFLLARHINTSLQLDSQQSAHILSKFPVLSTQWTAIGHFRSTILQVAAECLCSILLLEDSTPRQVFNELLILRTSAVQQLFQGDDASMSIKTQVCSVIQMIITTVHQIYAVFYDSGKNQQPVECNLLMKILQKVTRKGAEGAILTDSEFSMAMKHLPIGIVEFRPAPHHHVQPIPQQNLHQNCLQWIEICKADVDAGLDRLLGFITSVKGLASIRDEVWDLLKQDDKMQTWEVVCSAILKAKLAVWEELFHNQFVSRSKAILQGMFDTALSSCKSQFSVVLNDLTFTNEKYLEVERNLSRYVWVESPQDVPAHSAWLGVSSKTLTDCGTLMMKAKAYTPAVQSLCQSFDNKLQILIEDGTHYLRPCDSADKPPLGGTSTDGTAEQEPFDRYADSELLQLYMQSACETCVAKLLDHLSGQLDACKQQLSSTGDDPKGCTVIVDRLLLIGRFSSALTELCPYLHQCIIATADKPDIKIVRRSHLIKSTRANESSHWTELKTKLLKFSNDAYSIWSEHVAIHLTKQFAKALLDNSGPAILHSAVRWNEIEIQEEREDGKTLKSTIRVPMQASWFIQSLFYNLCVEINRVGGHAVKKAVLYGLMVQMSDEILSLYEKLLWENKQSSNHPDTTTGIAITQTRALQMIFDVKFLFNILPRKEDEKENKTYQQRLQNILDEIENFVDPFDLDVFSPYMLTHLQRQTQRCQVLYGALTSLDKHGLFLSTKPPPSSQQEQHNILQLSAGKERFPLLPLSVQTRSSIQTPVLQSPKPKSDGFLGPSSPPPVIPSPQEEQASGFLGTMSTIWFTNVTGGKAK